MSPRASFHSIAEENGRVMTWADMDSPRPWVAVYSECTRNTEMSPWASIPPA
ncbi:unnamed protein product [Arabidopsis halleri]